MENWKPVSGYEGKYEVSDQGNVRSLDRTVRCAYGKTRVVKGKPIKPSLSEYDGRHIAHLWSDNRFKNRAVHVLVAEAFISERPEGRLCCHDNGDVNNNSVQNLYWGTPRENMLDKRKHGTDHEANKRHCPRGHLLKEPNLVRTPTKKGSRSCLACARASSAIHGRKLDRDLLPAISLEKYRAIIDNLSPQNQEEFFPIVPR